MKRCPLGLACAVIAAGGVPALASEASPRPRDATPRRSDEAPGDIDVSFSGDGMRTTASGLRPRDGRGGCCRDKLLLAGTASGNCARAGSGVDGALDPSFSGDGLVPRTSSPDDGQGAAIETDGKIVVAGGSERELRPRPFTTGGGLDPSFSGDGKETTEFGPPRPPLPRWCSRPTAGSWSGGSPATISRWPATTRPAALDPSFSGDGRLTTDFGGIDSSHDVAIGADGTIVAMGTHAPPRCGGLRRGPLHRQPVSSTRPSTALAG